MAPLLSVTLAAPSTLDTRGSCPTNPCGSYEALIDYCGNYYNVANLGEPVGADAIKCMCGSGGAEGIHQWDGTTMDEGFLFVNQCYSCVQATGDALKLLTRWELACNTWVNVDMEEALTCWNENEYCYPLI